MMIKRLCILAGTFLCLTVSDDVLKNTQTPISPPQFTGTTEDPFARSRYEWMKLRSPRTGEIPDDIRNRELHYAATLPTKESVVALRLQKGGDAAGELIFNWERKGPFNLGGRTRALALDVSDPSEQTILAGGVSGGMWRSTDDGITWTKTTHPSDLHSVTALAQDLRPGKANIWYFGAGEFSGNTASDGSGGAFFLGDGIFKSTDGGVTWVQLQSTVSGTPQSFDSRFDIVWNIVTDSSNHTEDEVYVATYGTIKKSSDGGTAWSTVVGGEPPFSPYSDVAITSDGVVYATLSRQSSESTVTKGIYRSEDGDTWKKITPANFPIVFRRIVIGISPSNENVVYFLAETPGRGKNDHSFWKYTYMTGDGSGSGGTWEDRSANLPAFGGKIGDFDTQGSYDMVVNVKPDDENVVFLGGISLFRSTNGFASSENTVWIGGYSPKNDLSKYERHHPDLHANVFSLSDPSIMYSSHDGGVSKTVDNMASDVSWISLNRGYFTTQFYTVAIDRSTPESSVIVGGMQDNGTYFFNSSSNAADWVNVFGGDGSFCAIADGGFQYYVSAQNGITYRFALNSSGKVISDQWTRVDMGGDGFLFINPFILNPNNTNMMFMPRGKELWRNSNVTGISPLGSNKSTLVNWTNLTKAKTAGENISALNMAKTPENILYYGTDRGSVYKLPGADTGDPEPIEITDPEFSGAYVNCIAIDPESDNNVLVVFSNYEVISLFYTDNGGSTWTNVSGNLEENIDDGTGNGPSVRWAVVHPTADSKIYFVGTSTGLYSTKDLNGINTVWVQEGASTIGNVVVDMIDHRTSDGLVVVATHGGGVYGSTVVTAVADEQERLPEHFVLEQNFPNPFNPETKIGYTLSTFESVTLTIYNALGQKVRTLVRSEERSPGYHEEPFNGRDDRSVPLSSGVYFYQLQTGGFTAVKKMLLMK